MLLRLRRSHRPRNAKNLIQDLIKDLIKDWGNTVICSICSQQNLKKVYYAEASADSCRPLGSDGILSRGCNLPRLTASIISLPLVERENP
ncbi:MAG: hypothetical protein TECD_01075 [Hyphomicrobiaceae bacterium hypho_1]